MADKLKGYNYGTTEKDIIKEIVRALEAREPDREGAFAHGHGDQGSARADRSHRPYRPFQDSRKWRTETEEQARQVAWSTYCGRSRG